MAKSGNFKPYQRKFTCTSTTRYPYHYADGKSLEPGKPLAAFKSNAECSGFKGYPGRRVCIKKLIEAARRSFKTNINDKLPAGTALRSMAEAMAEHVVDWYATVHVFFDEDHLQLIEPGIPEADALVLLSEYLIIMMDCILLLRRNLMEFSMGDDQVDYQTRCLWVSL